MTNAMPKRQDVNVQETWDTSLIYKDPSEYRQALVAYKEKIQQFEAAFKGKLTDCSKITTALKAYEEILILVSRL
ncbi:oligoendopeptidase F, partial [Streptococcus pyogenes]